MQGFGFGGVLAPFSTLQLRSVESTCRGRPKRFNFESVFFSASFSNSRVLVERLGFRALGLGLRV